MTDRERLRELIYAWECEENKVSIADCDTDKSFERLIDKLLANGVIVPPCKVGSTIYMLVTKRPRVYCEPFTMIKKSKVAFSNLERIMQDFGKTVFLTREEAEKALAERGTPTC